MRRGLWNMDHASFFSEATFIEIGVYLYNKIYNGVYDICEGTAARYGSVTEAAYTGKPYEILAKTED